MSSFGDGDVLGLQADGRARKADLGKAGAQRALAGDEGGAARRAALLGVVVGEHHAFFGDAVDVRRAVTHQAERIGADIGLADIVAEDDEDVRPPARRGAGCAAAPAPPHRRAGASAEAAASVVPPSRMLRRSRGQGFFFHRRSGFRLLMVSAFLFANDAAKSEMACRRIHRFRVARGRAVAAAVVRRAKVRAALDDLAGNLNIRLAGAVAIGLRSTMGRAF